MGNISTEKYSYTVPTSSDRMTRRETDADSSSMEVGEEEEVMRRGRVRGSGCMKAKERKRTQLAQVERRGRGEDLKAGLLNVVARFKGEGGVKKVIP